MTDLFSPDHLARVIAATIPELQPGATHVVVGTVDLTGAQVVASFKRSDHGVAWELQAAAPAGLVRRAIGGSEGDLAMVKPSFTIGQPIRYKPGLGTYGYEDALEADGRLPGVVLDHTPAGRIRVELTLAKRGGSTVRRTVAPSSLEARRGATDGQP